MRAGRQRTRGSIPDRTETNLFSKAPRPALENTQPSIPCVQEPLSSGAKREGRESDYSSLFKRADTDNEHSYNSTPPYASRITQGNLYLYLYHFILRNKDIPYCFPAITAQQYIPTADSTKTPNVCQ
jgi:hypothetical protein